MKNVIYYASYERCEDPNIIVNKSTGDFGYGFYCTRVKEQAEKIASKYKTPIINSYELKNIADLDIIIFKEYNEEWLDFVVHCRNGGQHHYDVVKGFMCDDTIFDSLEEYINGYIDKQRLLDMMKHKWINKQISFHTDRALKKLKFICSEKIEK